MQALSMTSVWANYSARGQAISGNGVQLQTEAYRPVASNNAPNSAAPSPKTEDTATETKPALRMDTLSCLKIVQNGSNPTNISKE